MPKDIPDALAPRGGRASLRLRGTPATDRWYVIRSKGEAMSHSIKAYCQLLLWGCLAATTASSRATAGDDTDRRAAATVDEIEAAEPELELRAPMVKRQPATSPSTARMPAASARHKDHEPTRSAAAPRSKAATARNATDGRQTTAWRPAASASSAHTTTSASRAARTAARERPATRATEHARTEHRLTDQGRVVRTAGSAPEVAVESKSSPAAKTTTAHGTAGEWLEEAYPGDAYRSAPNPALHPARLKQGAKGWTVAAMEPVPAGPRGEVVPTPEAMDGEEFSPFGDMGGEEVMWDEGVMPSRGFGLIAGGEFLLVRPHFSESAALVQTTNEQSANETFFRSDNLNYTPGYQGAFRTYLGLRNCACGDEFRLTYFNLSAADTRGATATSNTNFCDFLCNSTATPGDFIQSRLRLNVNYWDTDFIRPFFNTTPCGDTCDPCACPAWDLRWSAGLRFADVDHFLDSSLVTVGGPVGARAHSAQKFFGFGPRMGLQGRRYLGANGRWSLYARGAGSLLVGNVSQSITNFNASPGPGLGPATNDHLSRDARVVPVAEVEIGATWWLTHRLNLSGGWMVQAWWDLGLQEFVSAQRPLDDANILGLDGFFMRGEFIF